jgi:hypothetical protein
MHTHTLAQLPKQSTPLEQCIVHKSHSWNHEPYHHNKTTQSNKALTFEHQVMSIDLCWHGPTSWKTKKPKTRRALMYTCQPLKTKVNVCVRAIIAAQQYQQTCIQIYLVNFGHNMDA